MKHNPFISEIVIAVVLIAILIFCLNPFEIFMPPPMLAMLILSLFVIFCIFASIIWRENARDEREALHRMFAGRIAFLAGCGMLITGIVVQEIEGQLDPWLVYALIVMILAKIVGQAYGRVKH